MHSDTELLQQLLAYLTTAPDPLCPNCGRYRVDPRSKNGWCPRCDGRRERNLESKRLWWSRNRSAGRDGSAGSK